MPSTVWVVLLSKMLISFQLLALAGRNDRILQSSATPLNRSEITKELFFISNIAIVKATQRVSFLSVLYMTVFS